MSNAVICDKCGKAMYTDSRSEKDAFAKITVEYNRDTSWLHLCKSCFLKVAIDLRMCEDDVKAWKAEQEKQNESTV